jgi:hypothetical protein
LQSASGRLLVLAAWALSENRRAAFSWRLIVTGLVCSSRSRFFSKCRWRAPRLFRTRVDALSSATGQTSFVFGFVGGAAALDVTNANNSEPRVPGSTLVRMSALSAAWHWRAARDRRASPKLQKTLSIGGAVGPGSTVFLGMIEARPDPTLSQS